MSLSLRSSCGIRTMISGLTMATVVVGALGGLAAGETRGPSAKSSLANAFKALRKSKNYAVDVSIHGGLSDNPEHKVITTTSRESYGGEVFGSAKRPILHMPGIKAFKMPRAGQGVIYSQGQWKRILSTDKGVKMDRLVDFPILILAEAAKYSKTAEWLEGDAVPEGFDVAKKKKKKVKKKKSKKKKGRTEVKSSKSSEDSPDLPTILRVTAPPKQALKTWIERVENSGCMSEG